MLFIVCGSLLLLASIMAAIALFPPVTMALGAITANIPDSALAIFAFVFCLAAVGMFWLFCGLLKTRGYSVVSIVIALANLLMAFTILPSSYTKWSSVIVFAFSFLMYVAASEHFPAAKKQRVH